jgi:hypothetical protein
MTKQQRLWALIGLISGVLTAIIIGFAGFTPDLPGPIRAFIAIMLWLFIAFAIWVFKDSIDALIALPQNFREMREASARAKRAKAEAKGRSVDNARPAAAPAASSATSPAPATTAPDDLSPDDEAQLTGWLNSFIKAGIIDGTQFDAVARAAVHESVAGWGEASPYAILMGIEEIGGGQMRAGGLLPTLGFLDTKGEQLADGFVHEVAMLDRVTGGALALSIDQITVPPFEAMADNDVQLDLRIGDAVVPLRWRSAVKYASTILPVHVARAYHALGRGDALATLWSDQGSFILRLTPAQYRSFNSRMERQECDDERFSWLHRETPFASGDPISLPQ